MALPNYYTSLEPFRDLLASGTGLLTYHHVGARPAGARIKGLYVSPKLFTQQMGELRSAGFSAPGYHRVMNAPGPKERRVFITFDDGFCDVLQHAAPVLAANGFQAIQFLVADLLGKTSQWQERPDDVASPLMDAAQIRDWLAAGHEIGSHTLSHPRLTKISPAQAKEEISASRKRLEDLFGRPVRHFCYPYGDWNPAVRDLVAAAGFSTACTTEFGVNAVGADALSLKRFTARYASRNWKNLWGWLTSRR